MDIAQKINQLRKVIPENGATQAEAIAACEMAEKLMKKYQLSEDDLKKVVFSKDMSLRETDTRTNSVSPASKLCGMWVGRFCGTKTYRWTDGKKKTRKYFGLKDDVEMAVYLLDMIDTVMESSYKTYKKEVGKVAREHQFYWGYRHGFADAINSALKKMIEERSSFVSTGTDLVVLKSEIVESAFESQVGIKLKTGKSRSSRVNSESMAKGFEDGSKVNLNRPVNERKNQRVR